MNKSNVRVCLTVACFVFLLRAISQGQVLKPQDRLSPRGPAPVPQPAGKEGQILEIRRLDGLGRHAYVRSPEYRTNMSQGRKPAQDWVQVLLSFETFPEWVDELVVQYYALAMTTEGGKPKYSFYKKNVRYTDLERDREHQAAVYLPPRAVKRYGDLVAVAVEVSHQGKIIATKTEASIKLPQEWWKDPLVVQNENVTTRDGYLLDRSETPFALIAIDDYEVGR
ncbi:MAG: hypothetical protein N2255_00910 [Kiritimatiellae bacterium]|nr:hypothetical protein [Kiritimatiellia bacterium]